MRSGYSGSVGAIQVLNAAMKGRSRNWRESVRELIGDDSDKLHEILFSLAKGEPWFANLPDGRVSAPIIPSSDVRLRAAMFLHEAIHGKAVAQTEVRKAEEETRELDAIRALSDRELEIEAIKVLAERGHRALDPGPEEVVYAGEDVPPADVAMSIWLAEAREPCYDE